MEFIHKKEGGLDALIEAHRTYVEAIDRKVTLRLPKASRAVSITIWIKGLPMTNCYVQDTHLNQLKELLDVILKFRVAVVSVFLRYEIAY